MADDLFDKVVLLTECTTEMGQTTALEFARLGSRLSLVAEPHNLERLKNVTRLCRKGGASGVLMNTYDLSQESECSLAVKNTVDHHGQLDVLVNFLPAEGGMADNTSGTHVKLKINTSTALFLTHQCLPHLIKTKGSIVHVPANIESAGFVEYVVHEESFFNLQNLVESVAADFADQGVRINVVNPISENIPTLDELARTVMFLASGRSSFINGARVPVDGDHRVRSKLY